MELEEAILLLREMQYNCMQKGTYIDPKSEQKAQAIEAVLRELYYLQKENEELKEIDLTTVHIKGVCDEKERWRNKIKDLIERLNKNELLNKYNRELQNIKNINKKDKKQMLNIMRIEKMNLQRKFYKTY